MESPEQQRRELVEQLHDAAADMSYYNAAEGANWGAETEARKMAQQRLDTLIKECHNAGINTKKALAGRGYLL